MRLTHEQLLERVEELLRGAATDDKFTPYLEDELPFDLAEVLEQLPEAQALALLRHLEPEQAAQALEHLEYAEQYRLIDHLDPDTARGILSQMSSDAITDLVLAIHPRQASQLLDLLPPAESATVRTLMEYPENSAGGRMTVDYISVREHMTAAQVLEHIRKVGREAETISYIYVVDSAGRLTGVSSLRDVILAAPEARMSDVMTTAVISVPVTMDQEAVARTVSQYDLVAVPVVSADNRLLGIITVDDVIDVLQEEATEDVYRMAATAVPEALPAMGFLRSIWALARPRLPWLVSLLFLEMGSSFIVNTFSGLVSPAVVALLAMFTVVMAGETGNAATQSLAVVVRGLATGEIETRDMPRVVLRELLVGVVVGLTTGAVLMLAAWFWQRSLVFGLAVGVALAANLIIAKVLGGLFPVIIQRLGIDPAVASGPFITTLTDNSSMLIYYGVAALILRHFFG